MGLALGEEQCPPGLRPGRSCSQGCRPGL